MSDVIKDLSELRLSYEQGELYETQVASNPHEQFLGWLNHALAANLHEPYAMSLATASASGRPHVRTVLLRGATEAGYDFYTNYDSQKGIDLAENPYAELLFYWPSLERQVRVGGHVVKFLNRNLQTTIINVHVIARLQLISVLLKVAKLKVANCYNSVFKTCNNKFKATKYSISRNSGVDTVYSRIIMNSGKGDQIVYMTA